MNSNIFYNLLEKIKDKNIKNYLISNGLIKKILIHKKSKIIEFFLIFKKILEINIFKILILNIKNKYQFDYKILIKIYTKNNFFDKNILLNYWKESFKYNKFNFNNLLIKNIFKNIPYINEKLQVILKINNILIFKYIKKYFKKIEDFYNISGFNNFKFQFLFNKKKQVLKIENNYINKNFKKIINIENIKKEYKDLIITEGIIFYKKIYKFNKNFKFLILKITNYKSSLIIKKKIDILEEDEYKKLNINNIEKIYIKIKGTIINDKFFKNLIMNCIKILEIKNISEKDKKFKNKTRIELNIHSNMSTLNGISSIKDIILQAVKWEHSAIAITDYNCVQTFPDAYNISKKLNIKILYGIIMNVIEEKDAIISKNLKHIELDKSIYVVFDIETTGLSPLYDEIIEISAVKIFNNKIIDKFEKFIKPSFELPKNIIELTKINNDFLNKKSENIIKVLKLFINFIKDSILVAHNIKFDLNFLDKIFKKNKFNFKINNFPTIDTLWLARFLYPNLKNHRLDTLNKFFKKKNFLHHRAIYDAKVTSEILILFLEKIKIKYNIKFHNELNKYINKSLIYKFSYPFHVTIISKNQNGIKDIFKLLSIANTQNFFKIPKISRLILEKYKKNLIIGSTGINGEIFSNFLFNGFITKNILNFYDYIEVLPKNVYKILFKKKILKNKKELNNFILKIINLQINYNKLVIATSGVHYLKKEDEIFYKILLNIPYIDRIMFFNYENAYFRTTDKMIKDFNFLNDENLLYKIVIENTYKIFNMVEKNIIPIKTKLYTPKIKDSNKKIINLSYKRAKSQYGKNLPKIIKNRLDIELNSIIKNGFSEIYLIAKDLVEQSYKDGFIVGSRGSVGSSLVATMLEITEINPLEPHYYCKKCKFYKFIKNDKIFSGFDLPDKKCPFCNILLLKDGQNIPFETFLGFHGDKIPDIDLNFSSLYQIKAHNYIKKIFGENFVYRAGTISTIAYKTAYGFVKKYEIFKNLNLNQIEINRLCNGIIGVKRTTGQHPGGIIIIPNYMDVYDFTPIQFPANDKNSEWKTTHFDFHSINNNIIKFDILGHDDPTIIKKLQELSKIDVKTISITDNKVLKIFSDIKELKIKSNFFSKVGTLGIPEFGTKFVRNILIQVKPKTFAELIQISGLSHGTNVWINNAKEFFLKQKIPLLKIICCRDDIMLYLIKTGIEPKIAFEIMEIVRKGKWDEYNKKNNNKYLNIMKKNKIENWYIESCKKIKYIFPKAHAAAYVLMALRVSYFKIYFPIYFYCAYFSIRTNDFDLNIILIKDIKNFKIYIENLYKKIIKKITIKEKNRIIILEVAYEMLKRGFKFESIDIYKSKINDFIIKEFKYLIPPLIIIPNLGINRANLIINERKKKKFLSKNDFVKRCKISKSLLEYMNKIKILDNLSENSQIKLF